MTLFWSEQGLAQQSTATDAAGKPVLSTGTAPTSDQTSAAIPNVAAPQTGTTVPAAQRPQDNLFSNDIIVTAERR